MQKKKWQIDTTNTSGVPLDTEIIVKILTSLFSDTPTDHLPSQISELSVLFTDDKVIQKLNAEYRDKDYPTDVLSFSHIEGLTVQAFETSLGELMISLPTAKRQASDFDNTFEQEILRLLVHGILHLLGYDHEDVSEEEVQRMHTEEDRLFKKFSHLSAQLVPGGSAT